MRVAFQVLALCLVLPAVPAAACKIKPGPLIDMLQEVSRDCAHPLCGQVIATAAPSADAPASDCDLDARVGLVAAIGATLARGGVVILGEAHDSLAQHRLQGAAISEFATAGPDGHPIAVVFEQIRAGQQGAVDAARGSGADLGQFKAALEWSKSGWGDAMYDAPFTAALDNKLAIFGGDVSREAIMKTAKGGAEALDADVRQRLGLDQALGAKLDDASLTEIEASHCGMMPKEAFTGMAFAQRYRDAHIADVVLGAIKADGAAILIAGSTHARSDRGVPWYLARRAPDVPVLSITFVEVEDGNTDPASYVPRDPDGKAASDFVVLTPRATRDDPCEKMRARGGK